MFLSGDMFWTNNYRTPKNTCTNHTPARILHRYLLYDVNPPEGFNLRRDVYIRMASLVKTLRKDGGDWVLVLPPWGRLYHWQSPNIYQIRIPWGEFFSLTSLQANVPVIEYEEFIAGQQSNMCSLFSAPLSRTDCFVFFKFQICNDG